MGARAIILAATLFLTAQNAMAAACVPSAVSSATLDIAGDDRYWAYLNGVTLTTCTASGGGCYKNFATITVPPALISLPPAENILAVYATDIGGQVSGVAWRLTINYVGCPSQTILSDGTCTKVKDAGNVFGNGGRPPVVFPPNWTAQSGFDDSSWVGPWAGYPCAVACSSCCANWDLSIAIPWMWGGQSFLTAYQSDGFLFRQTFMAGDPGYCGYSALPTPTLIGTITPGTVTPVPVGTNSSTRTPSPTRSPSASPTPTASASPTRSPTPTASPSVTPSATPSASPTATASPTWTPTLTQTATPSVTPTRTPTQTPTASPTQTATLTATQTRTETQTLTSSPTQSATPTATSSRTQTPTPSSSPTPTATLTVTQTRTETQTLTSSPTPTATLTVTQTRTETQTLTSSPTPTATLTVTQTRTETQTLTGSPTPTATLTVTQTRTETQTLTASPSLTATLSVTQTRTETQTLTSSPTPTATLSVTQTRTETQTLTGSPTPTATLSVTQTRTETQTLTLSPTLTGTSTATQTRTETKTLTASPSRTASTTLTVTPSGTPSSSASPTPSASPSQTPLLSPTATPTASATASPSASPTASPSVTASPSGTPSRTVTPTPTASPSVTQSFTSSPTGTPAPPLRAKLEIFNSAGERVALVDGSIALYAHPSTARTLNASVIPGSGAPAAFYLGPGSPVLSWDGLNDQGQPVSSGLYRWSLSVQDGFGGVQSFGAAVSVLAAPEPERLQVFNSAGELVRELSVPAASSGGRLSVEKPSLVPGQDPLKIQIGSGSGGALQWDGDNAWGQPVSSGVYSLRLLHPSDATKVTESITVVVLAVPVALPALRVGPQPYRGQGPLRFWAGSGAGALRIEAYDLAGERIGTALGPASGFDWLPPTCASGLYLFRATLEAGGVRRPLAPLKAVFVR